MPPLPPVPFSESPQALLRFPPPTGRRKGGPSPAFFSNLPAVSKTQAVASLLGSLGPQASLGLREPRGPGALEALAVAVGDFRNRLCSPLEELIHKYRQRALSCHCLRLRRQNHRINFGEGSVRPLRRTGRAWILSL